MMPYFTAWFGIGSWSEVFKIGEMMLTCGVLDKCLHPLVDPESKSHAVHHARKDVLGTSVAFCKLCT